MAGLWKGAKKIGGKAVSGLGYMAGMGTGKKDKEAQDAAGEVVHTAGPDAAEEEEMWEFGGGEAEGAGSDGSLMTFKGHTSAVYAVALSPSDQKMATGGQDKTLRLWSWGDGGDPRTADGAPWAADADRAAPTVRTISHDGIILSADISATGRHVVTGSVTGKLHLTDLKTAEVVHTLGGDSTALGHQMKCYMVKFTGAGSTCPGDYIGSCSLDRTVRLGDSETGALRGTFKGHKDNVFSCEFSTNGRLLASAGDDLVVRLWDWRAATQAHVLSGHKKTVWSTHWSASDEMLVSAGMGHELIVWDMKMMKPRWRNDRPHGCTPVHRAIFSPCEKYILTGARDRRICMWDVNRAEVTASLSGHSGSVYNLCFYPSGDSFLSTSIDSTIKLWKFPPEPPAEKSQVASVTLTSPGC